jgi:nucleotide-binding universal stress UspA family protein
MLGKGASYQRPCPSSAPVVRHRSATSTRAGFGVLPAGGGLLPDGRRGFTAEAWGMTRDASHVALGDAGAVTAAERVVCGVDGSPEAIEAARQASLLLPGDGRLLLVAAVRNGSSEGADADVAAARTAIHDAIPIVVAVREGEAGEVLEREARHIDADTIAIGDHGRGRAAGVLLGSVATHVIHHASCSVLVARASHESVFPRTVVVGVDGSVASRRALGVGRVLAARAGVPLRVLHVLDGAIPRGKLQAGVAEQVEEVTASWSAVDGLCAHAVAGDLLVLGSRELRGIRALGSVSEAVAHGAAASVLIVR